MGIWILQKMLCLGMKPIHLKIKNSMTVYIKCNNISTCANYLYRSRQKSTSSNPLLHQDKFNLRGLCSK